MEPLRIVDVSLSSCEPAHEKYHRRMVAMSKREQKKAVPAGKQTNPAAALRQELARRKKAELVDLLLELARADRGILRQLTARFDVGAAPEELVAATRQAIADATDFDAREINRNFDYDCEAYEEVKRNLGRLIGPCKSFCVSVGRNRVCRISSGPAPAVGPRR